MNFNKLFSNIAKEAAQNEKNRKFLKEKFPEKESVPLGNSTDPEINKIISNSYNNYKEKSNIKKNEKEKSKEKNDENFFIEDILPQASKEIGKERSKKDKEIVWLSELNKNDVSIGGGKGANLGEMFNIGLPVPPAFIVTSNAYKEFLERTNLQEKIISKIYSIDIENTKLLEKTAKDIQEMIINSKMPLHLSEKIIDAYENLEIDQEIIKNSTSNVLGLIKNLRELPYVAVRSSATTEDLESASFAGQQETFLNVKGNNNLIEAVKKCWASLFTARAIYYRSKKGFKHEKSFIAVIVQKMIESEKSGVTFSINPTDNNADEIVIEAVFGLGEGIVSGTIAPDRYVVDKNSLEIKDKFIVSKPIYLKRGKNNETVAADLPKEKQNESVLNDEEIKKLAEYAKKTEAHYKLPQDMEWAIESNKIYIVQTRPVTTYKKEIKKMIVQGEEKEILEGLGASPGIAYGTVKIIHDLKDLSKIKEGDILVTEMTNPDMVVTMQKAEGIITNEGGMTCHAAIVSREVGIPAIVGTRKATKMLKEGQLITLDAYNGKIYDGKVEIKPKEEKEEEKEIELAKEIKEISLAPKVEEVAISEESNVAPVEKIIEISKARIKTKVYMNLSEPDQIEKYKNLPFEGIGLMRLEFLIASKIKKHPLYLIELGQEEEYINSLKEGICKVAETINEKPIIVRFSDFKSNEYRNLEGGEKYEPKESNPMIGLRGVSRYINEEFEKAFRLECKAISKVREKHQNVHVMLPFVRTTNEVIKCLKIMKSEGLERSGSFKIFLMAEVPSLALIPEEFAELNIDGASIGSNDLTQLVLGIDRDSAILGRMGYFDERNKAVLMALYNIIKGFKKHDKSVSICGQAPSLYPEMVKFLIEEGIDSLSINPDSVVKVKNQLEEYFKN